MRSPNAKPGDPPHRSWADTGGHISLHSIWSDEHKTAIVAVEDGCGCQALIIEVEETDEPIRD